MRKGFTLVEVMVVLVVLGAAAALLIPCLARGGRHARVEACASNLRALHEGQRRYAAREGAPPAVEGKDFWRKLAEAKPAAVEAARLRCPLAERPASEDVHYLGPGGNAARLKETDPLGCDELYNHGTGKEGNVLLKSGEVRTDDGQLWAAAARSGGCRR